MVRHLKFSDIGSFRALLVKEAPAGVYCSNSLYKDPSAEMHLKGWESAELIFDIDAGALNQPCRKVHDAWLCKNCGAKAFGLRPVTCPSCKGTRLLELPWACRLCIDAAKKETIRLIDFLEFDFGVSPQEVKVFFSGNAGYHISVEKSQYELLDSHGRAELADYLAGRGISPSFFDTTKLLATDPGWRGRMARYIRDLPDIDTTFSSSGALYERRLHELVNEFSKKEQDNFLLKAIEENAVRIDPMVTTDIHRIFRMPETLNNKTGLVKKECGNNLNSFDPTIEPIALQSDEKAQVFVDMCPKLDLGGVSYGPFKSETAELPLHVGVYIVAGRSDLAP